MASTHPQTYAVSAGLALGLLSLGVDTLPPAQPMMIELSFARAWRGWPQRTYFPHVSNQVNRMRFNERQITAATSTSGRRFNPYFYWESGFPARLAVLDHKLWNPSTDDDLDFSARLIEPTVPWTAWQELAVSFLNILQPTPGD